MSCTRAPYVSVSWFRMTMAWGWRVLHHLDAFVLSLTSPFMGEILYIYAHEICKLCAVDCTSQRPALQAVPNFLQLVWLKSLVSGTWLVKVLWHVQIFWDNILRVSSALYRFGKLSIHCPPTCTGVNEHVCTKIRARKNASSMLEDGFAWISLVDATTVPFVSCRRISRHWTRAWEQRFSRRT